MAPPLSVGVQLPEVERDVRWPELVAMARAAEEVGFDSIWLGDHLLYRGDGRPERGPWDAWTTLAALAASTERVRLGPLVACSAFHPPGMLARMAVSIDEELEGTDILIAGSHYRPDRAVAEVGAGDIGQRRRGRLLEDLLVAALDRAVTLAEMDAVPVAVDCHLHLDVTIVLEPLLEVQRIVAERGLRLAPADLEHGFELTRCPHHAHALAAATGRRLDQDRVADPFSLR